MAYFSLAEWVNVFEARCFLSPETPDPGGKPQLKGESEIVNKICVGLHVSNEEQNVTNCVLVYLWE